ncbi:MAG: hypothetical protein IT489_05840 [Gammaproteobacteria bacterium]|nr:hypothetical protein [Gammaproteobacteria bacterium]
MSTGRRIIAVSLALALAACAGKAIRFHHDSKTLGSPEFLRDRTDCKLYANATAPVTGPAVPGPPRNQDEWVRAYYQCMEEKGWYPVDENGERVDYLCNYFDCF